MPTDNLIIPTPEQLMNDVVLSYAPLYSILNPVPHQAVVENASFKTVKADSTTAEVINIQDTEKVHVKVGETSKTFKKLFLGGKYIEGLKNARKAMPQLANRVIKDYTKQQDKEIWAGTYNNGLYTTSDVNATTETEAAALPATISGNNGIDGLVADFSKLEEKIETTCSSSAITVIAYGANIKNYLRKILTNGETYMQILRAEFPNFNIVMAPSNVLISSEQGFLTVARDLVDLHYTMLPMVENTGINTENDYAWANFIYGSAMVDVKDFGGIIKMGVTIS